MSKAGQRLIALAGRLRRRSEEIDSWFEWIYPYRSLHLTREGWFFLVVTMAIGMAALNTGHNLFYLVFAMLVSLIVVSGLLSERAVRSLRVERRLPREVFARSAVAVELRVRNASRRRASYAIEIRDGFHGEPRRRIGFIDRLDPGAERSFPSLWTFPRRGRQRFRNVHLVTRFPFGLFEKTRIVPAIEEVVVFPAITGSRRRRAALDSAESALRKNRLGEEILGLRPMLPEDDLRRVHWRVSARVGEWMVAEHGETLDRPLAVFFDSRGPAGGAFEVAVERAAAVLWEGDRAGCAARLYTWGASFRGHGAESLRSALGFLAEVAPFAGPAGSSLEFDQWRGEVATGAGGLFVTVADPPDLPAGTLLRVA